ncbi:unnamed protein product [Linum trigynum]|uniref:Secreted protein n=1 Tax=Linum trigynum TaxID=586398 RepID=A0AAV2EQU6_9ROSI
MVRDALSSLLALVLWIGNCLIQGVFSLFAASVKNQQSVLHGVTASAQSRQSSRCRPAVSRREVGTPPLLVRHPIVPLGKRSVYAEGPYERKHEMVCLLHKRKIDLVWGENECPPEPRPKKVRVQPLKGWRFWLPPTLDLGSEESLLHQPGTVEIRTQPNRKASDPMPSPPVRARLV